MPGVVAAGTFHQDGERVFWDVHNPANVVVIELEHEHFRRLVIEVEDPGATATEIKKALNDRSH